MKYKAEKTLKRKINKVVSKFNESLLRDSTFRGRFVLRQTRFNGCWYEDKSGYTAACNYRIYDKKTGLFKDEVFSSIALLNGYYFHMFRFINNFIVQDSGIWDETDEEREADKQIDYTKLPLREVKDVTW